MPEAAIAWNDGHVVARNIFGAANPHGVPGLSTCTLRWRARTWGGRFRRDRRFQHVVTATRPLACRIYLVATTTTAAVVATADHFALTQSPVSC
jgi:hypothetical protein